MSRVVRIQKQQPVDWKQILQEFILLKKAEALSSTTIQDYQYHVSAFFRRYPDAWGDEEKLYNCVLQYMAQDDIKPVTYNIRLVYLRAFFNFCVCKGDIVKNPLDGLKKRKTQDRIVDIPEDVLRKLLELPNKNSFSGLRDYALILLTLDTGIRPSEAFSLYPHHFDFKHLQVIIPAEAAKTRQQRILPISPVTAQTISQLINAHHPAWKNSPVFCSYEGKRMNRHAWSDRLEIYSKELGYKIRPYDLRHSFAVLYLRKGGHAFSLQNTLGHEDMTMTKRYVHVSRQDLKDIHNVASPINSLITPKSTRKRNI